MTRTVKNLYFNIIKKHGLSHDSFDFTEKGQVFTIFLINSQLSFSLFPTKSTGRSYQCTWNIYTPGFPQEYKKFLWNLDEVANLFNKWLRDSAKPYLDDMESPDLWTQYAENIDALPPFKTSEEEYEEFSDDEKIQIKQSVSNYRLLVIENYNPNDEQLEEINERLDYLSQAVDRLNRFDWKALAISTVISIGINLAVDTEGGRQLFELFQEAFSYLVQLLS